MKCRIDLTLLIKNIEGVSCRFWFERRFDLPFVPSNDIAIEFASNRKPDDGEEGGEPLFHIEDITWEHDNQEFRIEARELWQTADQETIQQVAAWFVDYGWSYIQNRVSERREAVDA